MNQDDQLTSGVVRRRELPMGAALDEVRTQAIKKARGGF
jgi:hypothetical protein